MKYNEELNKQFVNSLISKYELNSLEGCFYELQNIYIEEGGKVEFTCDSSIINLDCIEELVSIKENRYLKRTMDISFIITENSINSMVFADFKLRKKGESNFKGDFSKIEKKIDHSSIFYSKDYKPYKNKYIIYKKEVVPVAESKINRALLNRRHSLIAIDIMSFHSLFFNA